MAERYGIETVDLDGVDDAPRAIRELTAEIEARLKRVVLNLNEPAFEPFLEELEILLPPERVRGHVSISALRQRSALPSAR